MQTSFLTGKALPGVAFRPQTARGPVRLVRLHAEAESAHPSSLQQRVYSALDCRHCDAWQSISWPPEGLSVKHWGSVMS